MAFLSKAVDSILDRRAVRVPDREVPSKHRLRLFRQYGDFSLAYAAATDPELSSFGDARGFVAYAQKMGVTFALGDPVAPRDHMPVLLREMIDTFRTPVFAGCRIDTARHLADLGYRVNVFGHDTSIALPGHSFAGGAFKRVRYGENWMQTNGISMVEAGQGKVRKAAVRALFRKWKESRISDREVRFLNRPFTFKTGPLVRRFYALSKDGGLLGQITFDPVCRDGHVIGYLASQKARIGEGAAYLDLGMTKHAIDRFREEGLETVYLGLSPLAGLGPSGFDAESAWLRRASNWAFNSDWVNRRYFNCRGLAEYKDRFRGTHVPLYIALPPGGSDRVRAIALLRLTHIV